MNSTESCYYKVWFAWIRTVTIGGVSSVGDAREGLLLPKERLIGEDDGKGSTRRGTAPTGMRVGEAVARFIC